MRAALVPALLLSWSAASAAGFPQVRMDQRVELVSALALLAGGDKTASGFYESPIPYARRLRRELGPRRGHPAVATLDAAFRRGLTSLNLYEIALSLSPLPPYELEAELSYQVIEKLGGQDGAAQFLGQLKLFWSDADFAGFWSRSEAERRAMIESVEAQARDPFIREELERYTGLPAPPFALLLSPEAEPVMSWIVKDRGSVTSIFGPERWRKDGRGNEIFEFNLLGRPSDFWRESVEVMISSAAGASGDEAREIGVATAARIMWLKRSREAAELQLVKYARIGMPHLRAVFDRLADYETMRSSYPTLADFYPELQSAYRGDAQVSDYSGGLEDLWTSTAATAVVVPDASWTARARKIWPRARVLDAADAMSADLSGGHVIAVGSLEDNAWISGHWKELCVPLELTREGLRWSRPFREARSYSLDGRFGLITMARHPGDRMHGALLVTAAEPAALPALELPPARGVDFLVFQDGRVVKAGQYEKTLLPWRTK